MSTHIKSLGKKSSLGGKSTPSRKEDRDLPAKVIKGEWCNPAPEPPLSEEEKKLTEKAEIEHRAYRREQRELIDSKKRRDDALRALEKDPKRTKRDRSRRRHRSPRSKGSSRHTGYVSIESSSSSSSGGSNHKRTRRSVISPPPPADVERKGPGDTNPKGGEKKEGRRSRKREGSLRSNGGKRGVIPQKSGKVARKCRSKERRLFLRKSARNLSLRSHPQTLGIRMK